MEKYMNYEEFNMKRLVKCSKIVRLYFSMLRLIFQHLHKSVH